MSEPKRILLNERQCKLFLNDMHEFGYTSLTLDQVRIVAAKVHMGTWDSADVIAGFMVSQIDEALGKPKENAE